MLILAAFIAAAAPLDPPASTACPIARPVTHDRVWHVACDAAIAAATDPRLKAELLYRSAYGHNEHEGYFEAQRALQEAVRLDPAHASAWRELSYTENALGNYAPAEAAANRAMTLQGDVVQPYQERAMARHFQANLEGAFADREHVVRVRPDDAGARIGRAEAALWLGRFDLAAADLDAVAARSPTDEQRQQVESMRSELQRWRTRSAAPDPAAACTWPTGNDDLLRPGLIGDCTAAFLAATTPARRADFLTIRSLAWIIAAHDRDAAGDDLAIAAALDPGNANRHTNLAFHYLDVSHSWAAAREFDRSLAISESWNALAGRASAKYNLRDFAGARADAQRAFDQHPNDISLTVLGDLARDSGDTATARRHWLAAWRLGDRDDGLIQRLREIGVTNPENEPAPR